jgi:hypothetical protein
MKEISLDIVYYSGLKKEHFLKSLHSALSQMGCSHKIILYSKSEILGRGCVSFPAKT